MLKPRISVIVPAFKRVRQTLRTITLIAVAMDNDTDFNGEIIVSDCSPDNKLERDVKARFPHVVYTRPLRPGISTNKNRGAEISRGDILIFCDSDVEIEHDTLKKSVGHLANHPSVAGLTGKVVWKYGPKNGRTDRPEKTDPLWEKNGIVYIESVYSRFFVTWKKAFHAAGGYDDIAFNMRGEGADLSLRYWRGGLPLAYFSDIAVRHRGDAPDSIAVNVPQPELDVARDLYLLYYKYSQTENDIILPEYLRQYFAKTGRPLETVFAGLIKHYGHIAAAKKYLDRWKESDQPQFPFLPFSLLSDKKLLDYCIHISEKRLKLIMNS